MIKSESLPLTHSPGSRGVAIEIASICRNLQCRFQHIGEGFPRAELFAWLPIGTVSTSFSDIYSMVEGRGGIQRTRERAQQFTDRARQVVAEFPDSPYQRALCTLTDLVTERDR